MIKINGTPFYEIPGSCGSCPLFNSGSTSRSPNTGKGHCITFDEWHHRYINPPRRCMKLFRKAFRMPDGSDLVIVAGG